MKLIWRIRAELDLDQAIDYLIERNPQAAERFYLEIRQKAALLTGQPGLGRPGRITGTRELVVYPYILAYMVETGLEAVIILRVLHGARQWPDEAPT